jgi:hypothetical protein
MKDPADRIAARIARGRREIERIDMLKPGEHHPPGMLGGYDNFHQNYGSALDALRNAALDHPPPKGIGRLDFLAHALAMFEDIGALLDRTWAKHQAEIEVAAAMAQREREGSTLQ